MAALLHAESRRLYSWWWDSHNSPKNSKWLQENLTDMDIKVKLMIKLIEEDADSFAKRAEMYYKKRPELMKLVEEFYRAYRALAERYDHATVELRQAHRTMAEAFPNQIPCGPAGDCPPGSSSMETEPHTPETPHPMTALFDLADDWQKDSVGLSSQLLAIRRNGAFAGDNDAVTRKKGLKQLNEMFTSGRADHTMLAEGRIRKGLNFLEEDCTEHANCHGSRDHQKHELVDKEDIDSKIKTLQVEVSRLSTENNELKTQVSLECEHAHKAEAEVECLHQALSKLKAEEEAACLQYQHHLERLSNLEAEVSCGQEEIGRLKDDILMGAMKLNDVEAQFLLLDGVNQSLQAEMDTLTQKIKRQQQELTGNHEELEKLRTCIQDEQMHRLQADTALQSLQHSYFLSQEEKTSLKLELQQGLQMLKGMEFIKQALEDEVRQLTEENDILNKQKLSSLGLIKNLQDEISSLKEMKGKFEEEAELSTCQKNAIQQELYCLNEEKDDLRMRYQNVMEQVESVGLNATCLRSSVKDLQDENLKLKEISEKNNDEKVVLLESLENMEKLSEKNKILESSLSDTTASLEALRATLKTLEEYYQFLQDENMKLKEICQRNDDAKVALLEKSANMEKLSQMNMLLERSLSDMSAELQSFRITIKTLEEFYLSLQDENLEMKEVCQKNNDEKLILLEKLEDVDKLSEKNISLENSLSNTSAELRLMKETNKMLEESYQSLQNDQLYLKRTCQKSNEEKAVLLEKLEKKEKVLKKNMLLEKSLSDASAEVQGLRENLSTLEESFHSIQVENLQLKETRQKHDGEKFILSQKLESMEKLSEKSVLLEIFLSDTSAKLQELETKLKTLEETFQSLQEEKSALITERDVLVSQVECIIQNKKMLSEKNNLLENSLSTMNAELEGLREKSSNLEECCQSLQEEKPNLLAERNDLLSRVESCMLSLEDLQQSHKELQNEHGTLGRERELMLHHVDKLQILLNLEREEHTSLENQMHLVHEEAQQWKENLEEEEIKVIDAHIEIFVLQRGILEIKERSLSLSIECQNYVDALTKAKNMILELEKDHLQQQENLKSLSEESNKLKMVIHQVLKVLDICVDDGCIDRIEDQVLLLHILERIKGMRSSTLDAEDKNKILSFEKSINSTLLEQVRVEINNLKTVNNALEREAKIRNGEISMLQTETHRLLEENELLIMEAQAGIHREEVLRNEMEKVDGEFSELQEAHQTLLGEKYKLLDKNASLARKVSDLNEENQILQKLNDGILGEAMTQANLSLVFESISTEQTVVSKALDDDVKHLFLLNSSLETEIREMIEKMRMGYEENLLLKEYVERLEEYKSHSLILEDELNMTRNINDQLNHQNEIGKNLLSHKEVTLLQVSQQLEVMQSDNAELHKELGEGRIFEEHLESALLKKINEIELWERENAKLHKENEEQMIYEEHLESELKKKIDEVELWKKEVTSLYEDLNISVICALVFKEKALEHLEIEESKLLMKTNEVELWERENTKLHKEIEDQMAREVHLESEMQKKINEVYLWEREVTSLYEYLNASEICTSVFKEKAMEHLEIEESELLKKINEVELLERENTKLQKENKERMTREVHLESELLEIIKEVELWETMVTSLYEDLNGSVVCASVFKEKAMELSATCESLKVSTIIEKQRSDDERALMNSDVEGLKREVSELEQDNVGLKAEMAAYFPLILSLKKSISSLEHHALAPTKALSTGNQEVQEAHQNDISDQEPTEDHKVTEAAGVLELHKLQAKVQDVEKVIVKTMVLALQESSISKAKLNVAMEEIKELELKSRSVPEDTEARKDVILLLEEGRELKKDRELAKIDTEASQSKHGFTMKDIQLDHVLDPSSHRSSSYGTAKIQISETDDQMLELWETAEQECNFKAIRKLPASATANEETDYYQIEAIEEQKSEYPSSELQVEKELAVDNSEISKKAVETSQEVNARITESLAADAQRLLSLQSTVQELKKKMDKSGKSKLAAAFEHNNMKEQLKEVEQAIFRFADINRKPTKSAEVCSSSDSKVEESVGEMGNVQNRRVVERVRRSSDKIGKLELEVQKIQFMLLKHENQDKSKGARGVDRRKEAALRDYLSGGIRQGKKKVPCCACIRPATKG